MANLPKMIFPWIWFEESGELKKQLKKENNINNFFYWGISRENTRFLDQFAEIHSDPVS